VVIRGHSWSAYYRTNQACLKIFAWPRLPPVYVSQKDNVSTSGTLPISISDNLPVFVNWTTRSNFSNSNEHKYIDYRSLKNFSAEQFEADLKNIPWNIFIFYGLVLFKVTSHDERAF
jgi:hypothetical protein